MEYYRVEYLLENLKNFNEERKKEEKKQEDNSAMSSPMSSAQSMFNTAQKGMPNLGSSMPSFNPGNFNMGNLKF